MNACEERGARAGVIAGTVTHRPAVGLSEAGQYQKILAKGFNRLQDACEFKASAFRDRRVLLHDQTVREVKKAKTNRRTHGRGCCPRRNHGIE